MYKDITFLSFHLSGNVKLFILWYQMYLKLSTIKGAASFNNLGPILLEPVALVGSIFLRYFSLFHRIFLVLKKTVAVYQN